VGAAEVARVEALREKRAFDAALPPLEDVARLPQRLALVQQWEAREWAGREERLAEAHEARLAAVEAGLMVRSWRSESCACKGSLRALFKSSAAARLACPPLTRLPACAGPRG
jgi:hypothetical protein